MGRLLSTLIESIPADLTANCRRAMTAVPMKVQAKIAAAVNDGNLLAESERNIRAWLECESLPDWARDSLAELVDGGCWEELNDRFFRPLAFGTGGMRGRTIGSIVTAAERGKAVAEETPEHAAVGSNVLNDFNVIRATMGLYRYSSEWHSRNAPYRRPRLVIAHDVRHFSRHFCELAAAVWNQLGGEAFIFDGPRSTPMLSFSVRYLEATAGIVVTASHNPPHDNGYKVYFSDGGQVISPNAEGIIEAVNAVSLAEATAFLDADTSPLRILGEDIETAYHGVVTNQVLEPEVIAEVKPKVVFTPIHGTGGVATVPLLKVLGVDVVAVDSQWQMDPAFPTVQSPNPENAEALTLALKRAEETGADCVLATDPDCDRMGVAVRGAKGDMQLLSGNQIGSLLADFRIRQFKRRGLLPQQGHPRATLIKTFVTTPMQAAIAKAHGIRCIDTLTGFKWIGAKLALYDAQLREGYRAATGLALDTAASTFEARAAAHLQYGMLYVFGGEESYGYLASDQVRDKDGNAAVALFCEMVAALRKEGKSVAERLDELYCEHGYFAESLTNIYYEGASGAEKIQRIIDSYAAEPPGKIGDAKVVGATDFHADTIEDADGQTIPKERFFMLELDNGYRYAVRGSGTEPKIKFYLFAHDPVPSPDALPKVRAAAAVQLKALADAISADAKMRAGD